MDWKLELVLLPVTDVDRAKTFYSEKLGFHVDVDHHPSDKFRVVQLTPPGSACSISIGVGITQAAPGSVQGLHLVVTDIEAAAPSSPSAGWRPARSSTSRQANKRRGRIPNAATTAHSWPSATPMATAGLYRRSGEARRGLTGTIASVTGERIADEPQRFAGPNRWQIQANQRQRPLIAAVREMDRGALWRFRSC